MLCFCVELEFRTYDSNNGEQTTAVWQRKGKQNASLHHAIILEQLYQWNVMRELCFVLKCSYPLK